MKASTEKGTIILQLGLMIVLQMAITTTARAQGTGDGEDFLNVGQKIGKLGSTLMDKFDSVFYTLLDEAMTHITDDQRGVFKEMVLKHRHDLIENVRTNLINKNGHDNITLDDVRTSIAQELQNRVQLFTYLGSNVWNKINQLGRKWYGTYREHCRGNDNFYCFNNDNQNQNRKKGQTEPTNSAVQDESGREREFDP